MASNYRGARDNQHAHELRNVLSIASLSAAMADGGGRAARSSRHARLLSSASGVALSVASVVVVLGVCVPDAAQAQTTVNPVQTTTFTLTAAQNPIIFGSTTNIDTRGLGIHAVAGNAGYCMDRDQQRHASWCVELFNGGTVVNQVGGTISGQQSGIAIINNAGTVTNAGIITAQSSGSNGIFLGEGGTVTNQAGGTISGDTGIFIDTFAGTVVNAGTISGSGGNNGPSMGFQRNRHPHAEAANRFGAERRCDWQFRLRRDQ
jgi:hypothetical protein